MKVSADISGILEREEDARHSLRVEGPRLMLRVVEKAAANERRDHGYQNRTGRLERSTTGFRVDADTVALEANTEYAAYVNGRGLMTIVEQAENAAAAIGAVLAGERDRVSG